MPSPQIRREPWSTSDVARERRLESLGCTESGRPQYLHSIQDQVPDKSLKMPLTRFPAEVAATRAVVSILQMSVHWKCNPTNQQCSNIKPAIVLWSSERFWDKSNLNHHLQYKKRFIFLICDAKPNYFPWHNEYKQWYDIMGETVCIPAIIGR